ncbi:MAG TPA: sulfatase-like hydrolase/transferase [Terriglobales bacterium]|nr:sulfatase-like hydrolase/transferase [Terriglobales bacterium]
MTRRLACIVWLTVWLTASALGVPAPAPPISSHPNIILITLDTTRADRMGFQGSKQGLTPNLDALALDSAVFTHAYAQAPLTPTSHASILTGTYPQFHQVNDFQRPLAADLPYAPAILRSQGYHTAAFIGAIVLNPDPTYAPGFDRGFDTYDAGFHKEGPAADRYRTVQRRGDEVVAHALAWLNKHPKGPFFIWIHLYDAHDPYDPPEPYKTRYASAPYDGAIAYEDAAVGKLLRQLKLRGLYDAAIMAVTADHGESLGAHGEDTHGIFLYDETIQVPLLIKLPIKLHANAAGTRIDNRVELVDILPTLLQEVRIEIPKAVQGESLLALIQMKMKAEGDPAVEAWRGRAAYAQSDVPRIEFGWSAEQSLRAGKYLYIQAPRRELYDQAADPKADHDLASSSAAVADTLASQLRTFRQKTTSQREAPKPALDPTAQQKLGALGYMASGGNVSEGSGADQAAAVDPKDKIEIADLIHRAFLLADDHRDQEAIPLLQQLIAKDPDAPFAYALLGQCFLSLKQYSQAVPLLRKAVYMRQDMTISHFHLAAALVETKDFDGAADELEVVVARMPEFEEAHQMLETAYVQAGRIPEAIKECEKVLESDPDDYGTNLLLGRVLVSTGDPRAALPKLKKAAALEPKAAEPHRFLAEAYTQLGQRTDVAREQAAVKRLSASAEE